MITKFHAKAGDNLGVGKPLFDVDPDAPKPAGAPAAAKPAEKTEAPKAEDKQKTVEAPKEVTK